MPVTATTSKTDRAYTVLRERILGGTYGPGYRLVVDALARELGMSPIPLREAVSRLEAEGWVVTRRYAGAQVAPADAHTVVANMELLATLEGMAMRLLAHGGEVPGLDEARRINSRMREALDRLSVLDTHRLNRDFHFALYEGVPNAPLRTHLRQVWDDLDRARRSAAFYLVRAPRAVEEHDRLLTMLREGADPVAVERFARDHKLGTLEVLLRENPEATGERSLLLN